MKVEDHRRRREEMAGWPIEITTYRLGDRFYCKVDNVEPGATVARAEAGSLDEAERRALEAARRRLERTRTVE